MRVDLAIIKSKTSYAVYCSCRGTNYVAFPFGIDHVPFATYIDI